MWFYFRREIISIKISIEYINQRHTDTAVNKSLLFLWNNFMVFFFAPKLCRFSSNEINIHSKIYFMRFNDLKIFKRIYRSLTNFLWNFYGQLKNIYFRQLLPNRKSIKIKHFFDVLDEVLFFIIFFAILVLLTILRDRIRLEHIC